MVNIATLAILLAVAAQPSAEKQNNRQERRAAAWPYQAEAERAKAEAVSLKERLKALKAGGAQAKKVEKLEGAIREQEKAARDAQAKVDDIDSAVFDLKAVNPNAVVRIDERTPEEVIRSIEGQGKVIADALSKLRSLLQNDPVP